MDYRTYKETSVKPSLLGLGCMRLPLLHDGQPEIDVKRAEALVDYAYAHGVNYFDTAYPYHGGQSEKFIGKALSKYPRASFYLATKMPIWNLKTLDDAKRIFDEQLANCKVEYFDFYLCHALGAERFEQMESLALYDFLAQKKAEGRIRHLGFSFHDTPQVLERICKVHPWDFAQLQLNYLDWTIQQARRQYEILEHHHLPCIVMEPVRGGALASLCPQADAILQRARPNSSIASWALRYAASLPNVLVVLSGMSTIEQMQDNISTMTPFEPLSEKERGQIRRALTAYRKARQVPCTGCRYCMPCPFGVDIPGTFTVYNKFVGIAKNTEQFKRIYLANPHADCRACGACKAACPQKIDIPAHMQQINALVAEP